MNKMTPTATSAAGHYGYGPLCLRCTTSSPGRKGQITWVTYVCLCLADDEMSLCVCVSLTPRCAPVEVVILYFVLHMLLCNSSCLHICIEWLCTHLSNVWLVSATQSFRSVNVFSFQHWPVAVEYKLRSVAAVCSGCAALDYIMLRGVSDVYLRNWPLSVNLFISWTLFFIFVILQPQWNGIAGQVGKIMSNFKLGLSLSDSTSEPLQFATLTAFYL